MIRKHVAVLFAGLLLSLHPRLAAAPSADDAVRPEQKFPHEIAAIPLNQPAGLAFDRRGNLYVANSASDQILVYGPGLRQLTALTITAGLHNPTRVAFDSLGKLYVANTAGNSITVYDRDLQQITANTIRAIKPLGIAVDAYGDVFVAENSANDIKCFNVEGELVSTLSKDNSGRFFSAPGALAINAQDLYVGTGPTVGENDVTSYNVGEFLTRNPKEIATYTDLVNTGPTGIAFDSADNVYISDFYSGTATKYSPSGELLLVIDNQTVGCEGIAVSGNGNIAVANQFSSTITIYRPDGTLLRTLR